MADEQDQSRLVQLERPFLLAKPSASQDFEFSSRGGETLPPAVAGIARAWLHAHMETANAETVAVVRLGDGWWLLRAADQGTTDHSGRLRYYLAIVPLPDGPASDPDFVVQLVLGAFQARMPGFESVIPAPIAVEALDSSDHPRARAMLLTVALGLAPFAVAKTVGTAADAVRQIGLGNLDYIGLISPKLPSGFPGRRGIVISQASWSAPVAAVRVETAISGQQLPGLNEFINLIVSPERKESLLLLGMMGTSMNGPYSNAELDWLLNTPGGRMEALRHADAEQTCRWLAGRQLRAPDLEIITHSLRPEDADAVIRILSGQAGAIGGFLRFFPITHPRLAELLPANAAELLRALQSPEGLRGEPPEPDAVEVLRSSGLLQRFPVELLARLQSAGIDLGSIWLSALRREELPESVIGALILGQSLEHPPQKEPVTSDAWIQGVRPEAVLKAARWACKSQLWRSWWVDSVAHHPAIPPASHISLNASWAEHIHVWACEALRDGELSREAALESLGRWREKSPGPTVEQALELLTAAGITIEPATEALVGGLSPAAGSAFSQRSITELAILVKAGIVRKKQLVQAVLDGCSVAILQPGFDRNAIAMVDVSAGAPMVPPPQWDDLLLPLLAENAKKSTFWSRWPGGTPGEVRAWLSEVLKATSAGAVIALIEVAIAGRHKLLFAEAQIVAGALPASARVAQACLWARDPASGSEETIEVLISMPDLAPYNPWLKTRLLSSGPLPPMPELDAEGMILLFPLLNQANDIVRVVLAWEECREGEDRLLRKLLESQDLRNERFPPPAPDRDAILRRRKWVAEIARHAGWKHWSIALQQEQSVATGDIGA